MELKIEIETGEACLFKIRDLTEEYLPQELEELVNGKFKYSETISAVILAKHNSKSNNLEYLNTLFIIHDDINKLISIFTKFDSYFDFTYVVLPLKSWVESHLNKILNYKEIYCSDGINFYIYDKDNFKKVEASKIVEVNSINTTISKVLDSLVSICFIKKYFIDLCNQIYKNRVFSKCSYKGCVNKNLSYKRDLVWTVINLISYYTDLGLFWEALRLIEMVQDCVNIVPTIKNCSKCQ